jgi:hypothetical protein
LINGSIKIIKIKFHTFKNPIRFHLFQNLSFVLLAMEDEDDALADVPLHLPFTDLVWCGRGRLNEMVVNERERLNEM